MKEDNITRISVCPVCGQTYTARPALSRRDNKMSICPDCGILEALESLGIGAEERQNILETIHRCQRDNGL